MKNLKTTYVLIGWLLWMTCGAYIFHKSCGSNTDDKEVVSNKLIDSNTVSGQSQSLTTASFKESDHVFIQPLSLELSKRVDHYLDRMKSDKSENLIITALYGAHENNSGIFPDLGLARANNMKQLFVQFGIDPDRIGIKSKKVESDKSSEYTGLEFNYSEEIKHSNTLSDYTILFEHNPIILFFKPKSEHRDFTSFQRIAFRDLVSYMDLDQDIIVKVSGHTDDSEEREDAKTLSKQRANNVKNILVNNGLDGRRIKVIAYGADRPIASNKTSEGRASNRRVEIEVE